MPSHSTKTDGIRPGPAFRLSVLASPVGIAGHLLLAFAAVAALVLAVNRIEQHGSLVVSVTESRIAAPTVSMPAQVPPPAPIETTPPPVPAAPEPSVGQVLTATIARLTDTIARFDGEVSIRVDDNTPERAQSLQKATLALQTESTAFMGAASGHAGGRLLNQWGAGIKAHQQSASELIRLSDTRRDLIVQSSRQVEALDAEMKSALDGAWKILGRVVTRQSLVAINRQLDTLRRDLTPLAVPSEYAPEIREQTSSHLAAFERLLHENEPSLLHTQGAQWLAQFREDFSQLSLAESALLQADQARGAALKDFSASTATLARLTQAIGSSIPARAAVAPHPPAVARHPPAVAPPAPAIVPPAPALQTPATNLTAPLPHTVTTTSTRERELPPKRSSFMAWLSALTLVILLFICGTIALGIVLPVKRLTKASHRLATGELHVRVARGGIRELDSLALSFNQMAEQLAEAQAITEAHSRQLEERIAERTLQLKHLAEHDPLTELPNRRQLFSQLEAGLLQAAADGSQIGVFILDLDNFKNINDSVGHAYGDRVLQSIAQRLDQVVAGRGYSARLGGDEFTIVHQNASSREQLRLFGEQLLHAFQKPLTVDARELLMSVSLGASFYPEHAQSAEELLRDADAALFRAKQQGRNQLSIFSPELLAAAASRFSTEQALRYAIERGEFELAFQPEVRIDTMEVALVEALLRWRLPDGRHASTAEFLAIAEDSGLILEISDWVLRSAIEAAAGLYRGPWPQACVAINVSARQLLDRQFVERVQQLLRDHSLPAACIEFELTENVLQTGRSTIEGLSALRALGSGIALDDFGTGFSSLTSLEQLPLTRVKLDRSLITCIDSNARAFAIAESIIELGGRLGLKMTAEGIERPEQLSMLLQHESLHLQGYLLSRPVSAAQLPDLIATLPMRMRAQLLPGPGPTGAADPGRESPYAVSSIINA